MVGCRFADCVPVGDVAPVIHSVALIGPECRAGLGGSIKWAAVLVGEARHRSELARACTSLGSRPGSAIKCADGLRGDGVVKTFMGLAGTGGFEAADLAVA